MSLTDSQLKKFLNKKHDKAFEVLDRDSLGVRVSLKGKVAWQYRFRFNGKGDRVTLGYYPDISLKDAREFVPKLRGWLVAGDNPKLKWKENHASNTHKSSYTLIKLVKEWFDEVAERDFKDTTYQNYDSTVRKWIFNQPKRGKLEVNWVRNKLDIPFDNITNAQWMDFFDWISKESSSVNAGSVFKLLKTVVKWGLKREKISNSSLLLFTVKDVGKAPQVGQRTPSLNEIARLWIEIDKSKALPQTKICLKLIILSGGRNTAVRTAKWEDFDFNDMVWTIPFPKGKKESPRRGTHQEDYAVQKPERHPISPKVKELLDELAAIYGRKGYIFKGDINNRPLTTHAINRYCSRMSAKLFKEFGISKIVPHDFRRSIETIITEIDVGKLPICEKILGHKLKGTMQHYNKADYMVQQLEVYKLYWSLIKNEIEKIHAETLKESR